MYCFSDLDSFPNLPISISNDELRHLTDRVDKECPFAKQVSGISGAGAGEGIVWICITKPECSRLWFKTKGTSHCTPMPKPLKYLNQQQSYNSKIDMFINPSRLHQGVEYLNEMGIPLESRSIRIFIEWVTSDIIREERDIIEEHQICQAALKKTK